MIGSTLGTRRQLQGILFLLVIHSTATGFGLFLLPEKWFQFLGLEVGLQRFFVSQGGVFHLLMAGAYLAGMLHPRRFVVLVKYAIVVKVCAAVFLIFYFLFVHGVVFILLDGVIDACLGWLVWIGLRQFLNENDHD